MNNSNSDVLLARLEERLKTIFESQEKEVRGRERLYDSVSSLRDSIQNMDARLKSVENSLARNEPTIEEFITIKHKVVGAGVFGRWVWVGAGALIGLIAAMKREIFAWFAG